MKGSFEKCENVSQFAFKYYVLDLTKYNRHIKKFPNLLNGIKYCFGLMLMEVLISHVRFKKITIYDRTTQHPIKIVCGSIYDVYKAYLYTYPNSQMINVDDLIEELLSIPSFAPIEIFLRNAKHLLLKPVIRINDQYKN